MVAMDDHGDRPKQKQKMAIPNLGKCKPSQNPAFMGKKIHEAYVPLISFNLWADRIG